MEREFDLLGDPIPDGFGGRGRPEHIPTSENRLKIRVLLAFGWTNDRIAKALRIARGTLRKHYSADLRFRDEARDALKASHLVSVYKSAIAGGAGAQRLLGELIAADERREINREFGDDGAKPEHTPKLGKKEQARLDARAAVADSDGDWGADLDVGTAPVH